MTSKVLDLATVAHALNELCNTFFGEGEWAGFTAEQREFLTWYAAHRDEISKLDDLEALASTEYAELNQFLTTHGFEPMFQPFAGIGVASILDMLIEWIAEGSVTQVRRPLPSTTPPSTTKDIYGRLIPTEPILRWEEYPGFRLGSDTAEVYDAAGYKNPLVRLHTKTGHSLWLMKADEPASGLELNRLAQQLLTAQLTPSREWTVGATMPMLEMDVKADLSWMIGTTVVSPTKGKYKLQQAFQRFKLRANEKGAHVKVVTGMVFAMAAAGPLPSPYILNDPFIGFFTQPDNDTLPLAAFWADTDVWQKPSGALEEL